MLNNTIIPYFNRHGVTWFRIKKLYGIKEVGCILSNPYTKGNTGLRFLCLARVVGDSIVRPLPNPLDYVSSPRPEREPALMESGRNSSNVRKECQAREALG